MPSAVEAAAVEFAVACPLLLLLFVGAVDVGRAILVQQTLVEAARGGSTVCREGGSIRPGGSDMVDLIMRDADLRDYAVQFDPGPDIA